MRLTDDQGSDRDPAWSPDGERIAFVSDRSGAFEIYSMTDEGEDLVRHTQTDAIGFKSSPTWAPDDQHVAFSALLDVYQIHVLDVEESRMAPYDVLADFVRPLTNRVWNSEDPAWSPEGDRIAFTTEDALGQNQIHLLYLDDGRKEQLTTSPVPSRRPVWAPDAATVAFESNASGDYEIYVVRADGTGLQRLTHDSAFDAWPSWSAEGQYIVFSSNRDGALGLYFMRSDGSDVRRLEIGPGDAAEPAWSPDGSYIAFVSNRDGNDEIYRIDAPVLQP